MVQQLTEIEEMVIETASHLCPISYQCSPFHTLNDVELDLQEAEAKLKSINRCTEHLKYSVSDSVEPFPATELKVQHASLKQTLATLSAAGHLLSRLLESLGDPAVRSFLDGQLPSSDATTTALPVLEPGRVDLATTRVQALTAFGQQLWIRQLELRELSKASSRWPHRLNHQQLLSKQMQPIAGRRRQQCVNTDSTVRIASTDPQARSSAPRLRSSLSLSLLGQFKSSPDLFYVTGDHRPARIAYLCSSDTDATTAATTYAQMSHPSASFTSAFRDSSRSSIESNAAGRCSTSPVPKPPESGFASASEKASLPSLQSRDEPVASDLGHSLASLPTSSEAGLLQHGSKVQDAVAKVRSMSMDCLWASCLRQQRDTVATSYSAINLTPTTDQFASTSGGSSSRPLSSCCDRLHSASLGHCVVVPSSSSASHCPTAGAPRLVERDSAGLSLVNSASCTIVNLVCDWPTSSVVESKPPVPVRSGQAEEPSGETRPATLSAVPVPQFTSSPSGRQVKPAPPTSTAALFPSPIAVEAPGGGSAMAAGSVAASPLLFFAGDEEYDDGSSSTESSRPEDTTFSDLRMSSSSSSSSSAGQTRQVEADCQLTTGGGGAFPEAVPGCESTGVDGRPVSSGQRSEDVSLEWDDSGNLRHTKSGYLDEQLSGSVSPVCQLSSSSSSRDRTYRYGGCVECQPFADHLFTAVIDPVLSATDDGVIEIAVTPASMSPDATNEPDEGHAHLRGETLPTDGTGAHLPDDGWLGRHGRPIGSLSCRRRHSGGSSVSGSPGAASGNRIRSEHRPVVFASQQVDSPSTSPSSGLGKSQFDYPHPEELSAESILTLLTSIRDEANPLIGLLVRLERSELAADGLLLPSAHLSDPGGAGGHELGPDRLFTYERTRAQIDIDRSFLEYYGKHLDRWSTTADDLHSWLVLHSADGVSPVSSLHSPVLASSKDRQQRRSLAEPADLGLLVETFSDWLTMLKGRHSAAQWLLVRRALWMDHLSGLTHEADASLAGAEKRSQLALQQAIDLVRSLANDDPAAPSSDATRCRAVLRALEDLQNLNDSVSAIQVRLGSGHMLTDLWHRSSSYAQEDSDAVDYLRLRPEALSCQPVAVLGDVGQEFIPSPVFTGSSSSSPSPFSVLSQRACSLRRQLYTVIRRLENAAFTTSLSVQGCLTSSASATDQNSTGSDRPLVTKLPAYITYESREEEEDAVQISSPTPPSPCRSVVAPLSGYVFVLLLGLILVGTLCLLGFVSRSEHGVGSSSGWLGLCPTSPRAGTVAVELGPSWFLQQLVCLQLPPPEKAPL